MSRCHNPAFSQSASDSFSYLHFHRGHQVLGTGSGEQLQHKPAEPKGGLMGISRSLPQREGRRDFNRSKHHQYSQKVQSHHLTLSYLTCHSQSSLGTAARGTTEVQELFIFSPEELPQQAGGKWGQTSPQNGCLKYILSYHTGVGCSGLPRLC